MGFELSLEEKIRVLTKEEGLQRRGLAKVASEAVAASACFSPAQSSTHSTQCRVPVSSSWRITATRHLGKNNLPRESLPRDPCDFPIASGHYDPRCLHLFLL